MQLLLLVHLVADFLNPATPKTLVTKGAPPKSRIGITPPARYGGWGICLLTASMLAACLVPPSAAAGEYPATPRQNELIHLLLEDCGSCHGMTLKGGLGPSLRPEALQGKDSDVLAFIIRQGIPGTPMPPWSFEISDQEALWLADALKGGQVVRR